MFGMEEVTAFAPLPTDDDYVRARENRCDTYYRLPQIVACFIERANNELPDGYRALPWTLNRVVTIFSSNTPIHYLAYEDIEDNIVRALDALQDIVQFADITSGENHG